MLSAPSGGTQCLIAFSFFLSFSKLPGSKGTRRPSWRPTVPLPVGVTPISCTRSRTHADCTAEMESVALASRLCTRSRPHHRRRQGAGRKVLSLRRQQQGRAVNSVVLPYRSAFATISFGSCISPLSQQLSICPASHSVWATNYPYTNDRYDTSYASGVCPCSVIM